MNDPTICTTCGTVYLYSHNAGEECPECKMGILVLLDQYVSEHEERIGDDDTTNYEPSS